MTRDAQTLQYLRTGVEERSEDPFLTLLPSRSGHPTVDGNLEGTAKRAREAALPQQCRSFRLVDLSGVLAWLGWLAASLRHAMIRWASSMHVTPVRYIIGDRIT